MMNAKPLRYYLTFIGLGIALWLSFLIVIRLIGPTVFSTGNPLLLVAYLLSLPLVWLLTILIARLTGIPTNEMLVPIAIIDFSALLLDGLAVGFTDLYGPTHDQIAAAAAYLLWGVGLTLICAVWLSYRKA
ncbi:MAG: hypothetical protein JNJ61_16850 [Anaerolineae bacterium]|nr:hypothetical protein [Anaerolineae bacterium]